MPLIKSRLAHPAVLLFVLFSFAYKHSFAQYGVAVRLSYVNPIGDLSADMKKTIGFDISLAEALDHGNIMTKVGLYYTNYQPRLDTFPISIVREDYIPTVFPGVLVWKKFRTYGIFADFSFKIAHFRNWSLFIGPGFQAGKVDYSYYQEYKTVGGGNTEVNDFMVGIRSHINIDYTINSRWKVALEAQNIMSTKLDWSMHVSGNNYSLGVIYFFNPINK